MKVEQIAKLVNEMAGSVLGETEIMQQDLSNVVDVGNTIIDRMGYDKYVGTLINTIGRTIFVDRPYTGRAPTVRMDGWTYGSIMRKISSDLPDAVDTQDWQLVNGASYDPHIFYQPKSTEKFFNTKTTFSVNQSITDLQIQQSFQTAEQLNGFLSMIINWVHKKLTLANDTLVMGCINNFIGETLYKDFPTGNYSENSTARCVNLLKLYNDKFSTTLTAEDCFYDRDFLRFASYILSLYVNRMSVMTRIFNMGEMARFTPKEYQHVIILDDFMQAAYMWLQSDTWHNEFTKLPMAETVTMWQGTGLEYSVGTDVSEINVKTSGGHEVHTSGIIGVIFDNEALGVTNFDQRVRTEYNSVAEFTNYFYKQDAGYFNDFNENFVVFFVA